MSIVRKNKEKHVTNLLAPPPVVPATQPEPSPRPVARAAAETLADLTAALAALRETAVEAAHEAGQLRREIAMNNSHVMLSAELLRGLTLYIDRYAGEVRLLDEYQWNVPFAPGAWRGVMREDRYQVALNFAARARTRSEYLVTNEDGANMPDEYTVISRRA